MKFVDPKNDVAFKKIFGNDNKKEILISFLNNILDFVGTDREILDITIQNPYQTPKLKGLKDTFLDIKALDKRGVHYIIEMQVIHTNTFKKRVLYYVSKAYAQQLAIGEDYPSLNQVIFLGFVNFTLFKKNPNYATRHLILDEETKEHVFTDFDLNFIELPKFEKTLDQLSNIKDKWIYFVKHAGDMSLIPSQMNEPKEIHDAFDEANKFTWSEDDLEAYIAQGMAIADEWQRVLAGEQRGEERGIEKGIAQGIEKGIVQGKIIGREEGGKEKALAIAKAMLEKGIPIDTIADVTGLTKEEFQ